MRHVRHQWRQNLNTKTRGWRAAGAPCHWAIAMRHLRHCHWAIAMRHLRHCHWAIVMRHLRHQRPTGSKEQDTRGTPTPWERRVRLLLGAGAADLSIYLSVCLSIYLSIYLSVRVCIYICKYNINICVCSIIYLYTYVYVHMYIDIYTYIYIYMYIYIYIGRPCAPTFSRRRSRNDHTLVPGEPTRGTRPSDRGVSSCLVTEVSHHA